MKSIINLHIDAIAHGHDGRAEVTLRVIGDPQVLNECGQAFVRSGMVVYRGGMEAEIPADKVRNMWDSLEEIRSLVLANKANIERLFQRVGAPMAILGASLPPV